MVAAVAAAAKAEFWDRRVALAVGNILLEDGWDRMAAVAVERHPVADHQGQIDAVWVAYLGEGFAVDRGKVCQHEVAEECSQEDTELGRDNLAAVLVLAVDTVVAVDIGMGIAAVVDNLWLPVPDWMEEENYHKFQTRSIRMLVQIQIRTQERFSLVPTILNENDVSCMRQDRKRQPFK